MGIVRTNYVEASPGATTYNISYECPSYYRGLGVGIVFSGTPTPPVLTSFEYAGEPLTLLASSAIGTAQRVAALYYLENPAQGLNSLIVDAGIYNIEDIRIISYRNVSTSSLINTSISGIDGSGDVTWNLTTTTDDAWALSFLSGFSGTTDFFSATNFTLLGAASNRRMGDSNGTLGSAGSKAFAVPRNGAGSAYYISAAIAPAVAVPILTTAAATEVALTTFKATGEALYDGDATITERGFVYDISPTPVITDNKKVVSGTLGEYNTTITGLAVNTTYYVRAYATNSFGTGYGEEVTVTTLNINQYEVQKEINAVEGQEFVGQINVTGTVGTVTVKLGTNGVPTVIAAGAGASIFTGAYSGQSGLIITRSADFDGTIDNVYYVAAPTGTTVNFDLDTLTIITAIDASVFFRRIEENVFNSFTFYRYLDLLFKDLDGFVEVTVRYEREDLTSEKSKTFSVGNINTGTVSPFQKKRVSFLIKNQAIIIGLSNANVNETFSIAQFILTGHKKSPKMFSPSKIISLS